MAGFHFRWPDVGRSAEGPRCTAWSDCMSFTTSGATPRIDHPGSTTWYHGSSEDLTELRAGSSITRNKELAVAFSHRPTELSVADDGAIRHNGTTPGCLYVVDEAVGAGDVRVHPSCSPDDPWEWVTQRPLRLKRLALLA